MHPTSNNANGHPVRDNGAAEPSPSAAVNTRRESATKTLHDLANDARKIQGEIRELLRPRGLSRWISTSSD